MVLYILRALFVLLMTAVGWIYLGRPGRASLPIAVILAILFLAIDLLPSRRKISIFAGTFFGLLVGIAMAYALGFLVELIVDQYSNGVAGLNPAKVRDVQQLADLLIGIVCSYLAISFVLQTKDDFRFIIPYVEFSKQTKGARPMLLDTSVLIDGRITDIVQTGLVESQLVVPNFVIDELQAVADSADRLKRTRGRRGLDMLAKLRKMEKADVAIYDAPPQRDGVVDQQLVHLARDINARVLTNDFNLNKVAQLIGVDVININDLGSALRPVVIPGEKLRVEIARSGEGPGQGVGYLDDGTMVVVEQARSHVGDEIDVVVTRSLQTSAGRMIFGRMTNASDGPSDRHAQTDVNSQPI